MMMQLRLRDLGWRYKVRDACSDVLIAVSLETLLRW